MATDPLCSYSPQHRPYGPSSEDGHSPGESQGWLQTGGWEPVCSGFSGPFGLEHLVEPIKIKKPSGWWL